MIEPILQAPNRRGLAAAEARALAERILGFANADYTRVNVDSGTRGFTRSAMNRVTTAGTSEDVSITITSVFGKRVASIETNRLDNASLELAVKDSEALAKIAPEDPEYLPELGPQNFASVDGYYQSTGNLTTEARARAAALAIKAAEEARTVASGFIDMRAGTEAVATSKGLFGHGATTGVASTLTVRTPDGASSGWGGGEGADWNTIESERIGTDAVRKCIDWRGKSPLDPGKYEVVLEPAAVATLIQWMRFSIDARQADEGRSYFAKRGGGNQIGEKLFHSGVTLISDPAARNAETMPFTSIGLPAQQIVWIEGGVLKNLSYSRFWAERKQTAPVAPPLNLVMSGGSATQADMIRSIRRGVLITRLWYVRMLNPRTIAVTGLTRDGTFFIENGRISRPVNNFRFNQSIAELLQNIEMLGTPVRTAATEGGAVGLPVVVPPLKVKDFSLSSISDAV
jgi:predicted Zn-dependent protease